MEQYIVSARKYRPATFATVVGQKALTATLKNAIATDRLAHAYLFCGPRGVGKTSCARIFAKTINCQHRTPEGDACNQCQSCQQFNSGRSMNIIELDAASNNSVDDIRWLVEQVMVPPTDGKYRVFIIDEVHMLSNAAFNAFLKTLEEPPAHAIFILATTEKHKIIPTILSRCQIYDFSRITITDMVDQLKYVAGQEGITADESALGVIARKADGAMRDALSIFDQVAASSRGNITYESTIANLNVLDHAYYGRLFQCFMAGDVPQALLIFKEIRDKGFNAQFFINGLAQYMRDLMVARDPRTISLLENSEQVRQEMAALAQQATPSILYKAIDLCNEADLNYRVSSNKQLLAELMLIKLCQMTQPTQPAAQSTIQTVAAQPQATQPQPAAQAQPTQPQAAQPQRPAPAAPQQRPATTTPKAAPFGGGLRLNQKPATQQAPQPGAAGTNPTMPAASPAKRNQPYDLEALKACWQKFIAENPTLKIMTNVMRGAEETLAVADNGARVCLSVDSDTARMGITDHQHELVEYLRKALQHDDLNLDIAINEGPSSPTTWDEREILQHMREHYPQVVKYIDELQLTLS